MLSTCNRFKTFQYNSALVSLIVNELIPGFWFVRKISNFHLELFFVIIHVSVLPFLYDEWQTYTYLPGILSKRKLGFKSLETNIQLTRTLN